MNIGERIKEARLERKMTQAQLAEKSGIAVITLSQYERGKRQPRIEQLAALSCALCIELDYFINAHSSYKTATEAITAFENFAQGVENDYIKSQEKELLLAFNKLNDAGRFTAIDRVEELAKIPDYQKPDEN